MSSTSNVQGKRSKAVPRSTGRRFSLTAIALAFTAAFVVSADSAALHHNEQKEMKLNEDLKIQLEEALRNGSSIEHVAQRVRRTTDSAPIAIIELRAETTNGVFYFAKDTPIGPLDMINAKGNICPGVLCPSNTAPEDRSGILIQVTGWYFVYGKVRFAPITKSTLLGWRIVACHVLKNPTSSQCDLPAPNSYWFFMKTERQASPGDPGHLFSGRIMRLEKGVVLSIMPMYADLKIKLDDDTCLGAFLMAESQGSIFG